MPIYHIGMNATRIPVSDTNHAATVLFRLKPGTSPEQVNEMKAAGTAMVGQVPGSDGQLLFMTKRILTAGKRSHQVRLRPASSKHRSSSKGFRPGLGSRAGEGFGCCGIRSASGAFEVSTHLGRRLWAKMSRVNALREAICEETLAYDLEF